LLSATDTVKTALISFAVVIVMWWKFPLFVELFKEMLSTERILEFMSNACGKDL
jgi:hypothetical protein